MSSCTAEEEAASLRRTVHRAVELARAGHLRLAARVLERPPLLPITPARMTKLFELHPRRDPSLGPLSLDLTQCISPTVEPDALLRLIRAYHDGKAAGPSNLTTGHLLALASDPDCLLGLVAIVQDVVDGRLGDAGRDCITSCVSVPIAKPHSIDGVRPIAVPEVIYKIAGLVVLESIAHAIPDLFPTVQLGCGIRGGVEIAVHRTQLALERGGPGTVTLRLDFRNAFNERKRHLIAAALARCESTSPLWRFFMMAYGRPGRLGVYDRGALINEFMADEGVRQGCPIAAFLFALSVQQLYAGCAHDLRDVEACAVADDLTLTGPVESVMRALDVLVGACASDGPVLNLSKCRVLWPYPRGSHPYYDTFIARMRELGIAVRHDSIDMLGSTVGLGMARAPHCVDTAASHARFFAGISHEDMPAQVALLLLRRSGTAKFTYLTRVTPPAIIRRAAELFDERIFDAVAAKAGLPRAALENETHNIICTPLRFGGLGFRPHTVSSPAAYWASWANGVASVRGALTASAVAALVAPTATGAHLRDTYAVLSGSGVHASSKQHRYSFPSSVTDMWSFYGEQRPVVPHLQRTLSSAINLAIFMQSPMLTPLAVRDIDEDDDDEVKGKSPSTSSLWLVAAPSAADTNLTSHAFTSAIRHRYRLPCRDDLPARCVCGATLHDSAAHFHVCPTLRRTGVTQRHDLVVRHLVDVCKRLGLVASLEPPLRNDAGQRTRPDFSFVTHAGVVFVDVSVCCPFATSNAASPDSIAAREKQKVDKYAGSAFLVGAEFRPFVLSSLGEVGSGARDVVQLIVSEHHHRSHAVQPHLGHSIMTSVSVQLQAGNGLVDLAGVAALGRGARLQPLVPLHPEQVARLQQQRAASRKPRYNHFLHGLRRPPTDAADMPCCAATPASDSLSDAAAPVVGADSPSASASAPGESKRSGPPPFSLPHQHASARDSSGASGVPPGLSLHNTTTSTAHDMQGDCEAHTDVVAHSSAVGVS